MNSKQHIILRQLITADDLKGPIEEVFEYSPSHYRTLPYGLRAQFTEYEDINEAQALIHRRTYQEESRKLAVIIYMKEVL